MWTPPSSGSPWKWIKTFMAHMKWFNWINVDGHKRVPWCLWCYSECILAYKECLPAGFSIMRCGNVSKSNRSVFANFMFWEPWYPKFWDVGYDLLLAWILDYAWSVTTFCGSDCFWEHWTTITEHFTDYLQSYASLMSVMAFSSHFSFDIMKVFQFNNTNFNNNCPIDNKHVAQSVS